MSEGFLDSNVVVYSLSASDHRQAVATALLRKGGVISAQVLNEVASVGSRKLGLSWTEISEVIATLLILCPHCVPLTPELSKQAVRLTDRYGFAFYDGLIVAAALEAGCSTLFSEDMRTGLVVENRLTIVNPFSGQPSST